MFLFKQIGVGNMIKSILLTAVMVFGMTSFVEASTNTNSYGHKVKMSKFRIQKDTLYNATRNSTIEMSEAAAIIGVESSWEAGVKNKSGSNATGLFQYIPSTWRVERKMFAKEVNVSHAASATDARANIKIGIKGLERNKELLSASLGIAPENLALGDLYIAHLLGADRAIRVIKGNPNALISKYVKITKGNRNLYLTSKGKLKTVSQFRTTMNQKLERERKLYNQELNNLELTKLVEKVSQPTSVVINLPQGSRWYESS